MNIVESINKIREQENDIFYTGACKWDVESMKKDRECGINGYEYCDNILKFSSECEQNSQSSLNNDIVFTNSDITLDDIFSYKSYKKSELKKIKKLFDENFTAVKYSDKTDCDIINVVSDEVSDTRRLMSDSEMLEVSEDVVLFTNYYYFSKKNIIVTCSIIHSPLLDNSYIIRVRKFGYHMDDSPEFVIKFLPIFKKLNPETLKSFDITEYMNYLTEKIANKS